MAASVKETITQTEEPGKVSFHIRGRLYEIEEIEADAYERHAKEAVVDEDEGTVDMNLLTKLIALDAVKVDGETLNPETWGREKFPVVNRVNNEVRRLHYVEIETDEEKTVRTAGDAAKRTKKGPDRPNS